MTGRMTSEQRNASLLGSRQLIGWSVATEQRDTETWQQRLRGGSSSDVRTRTTTSASFNRPKSRFEAQRCFRSSSGSCCWRPRARLRSSCSPETVRVWNFPPQVQSEDEGGVSGGFGRCWWDEGWMGGKDLKRMKNKQTNKLVSASSNRDVSGFLGGYDGGGLGGPRVPGVKILWASCNPPFKLWFIFFCPEI